MAIQSLYEISAWNAKITGDTSLTPPGVDFTPNGIITELNLPTLERDMDTTKRAGELGIIPRPKFFNELEVTFTVKALYAQFLEALARGMTKSMTITATTCLQSDTALKAYIVVLRGFISSLPLGSLSADGLEAEVTMMCNYFSTTIDTNIIIYDPRNFVYSINGTNLFADMKTMIDAT
jgi:P2 family phage contractile tail tube protein